MTILHNQIQPLVRLGPNTRNREQNNWGEEHYHHFTIVNGWKAMEQTDSTNLKSGPMEENVSFWKRGSENGWKELELIPLCDLEIAYLWN